MEKLVWVVWDDVGRDRPGRRAVLLDEVAPALLDAGAGRLTVHAADEYAKAPSPTPFPLRAERPVGLVSAWVGDPAAATRLTARLTAHDLRVAGYRVEESVPTDYGDNAHASPRDWPDGQRSPGIVTINLLERPHRMAREAWVARWHGRMTPVSARIQPRTRYVRNLVIEATTPGAPPWEGIVEEAWPSVDTLNDPWAFYGASTSWQLVRHQLEILGAVTSFLRIWRVMSVPMSEYLIRT